jgi:hypothetical protein
VIKSEAQVKREREDLWNQITQEVENSGGANANQIIVRQNCEELFSLDI